MESPPKRVTRARAAAKSTSGPVKTTRIMTAAVKAKSAPASTATSKATKRKTRSEDDDAELAPEDKPSPPKKATRGRPRKTASDEKPTLSAPATRPTRATRTVKPSAPPVTTKTTKEADPAPVRPTRGRPRKVAQPEPAQPTEPAPQSKPTRSRVTAATKSGTNTTQAATKKSVKFQEPGKENVEPASKKEPVPTGLRGRPAKKRGPTPASKSSAQKSAAGDKKPLSPKKVTQVPVTRDYESEDELAAGGYTPTIKQLQKSPVKPPSRAHPAAHSDELQEPDEEDPDSTMQVNEAILNPPNLGLSSLASPARRMPASPFKDTMKSPARKIGAISFPGSALKPANKASGSEAPTPFKASLLQSSAKRPPSPIKGLQLGSAQKSQPHPGFKASMLQSPAKRAMPGLKSLLESRTIEPDPLHGSPTRRNQTQSSQSAQKGRPSEKLLSEEHASDDLAEDDTDELVMKPVSNIRFSGRLSAVLPRAADPDDDSELLDVDELPKNPTDVLAIGSDKIDEAVAADAVGEIAISEPDDGPAAEHMSDSLESDTDESIIADEIVVQTKDSTVAAQAAENPPQQLLVSSGNPSYELREKELEHGNDMDSEEEDESHVLITGTPTAHSLVGSRESRRSTLGFTALAEQFGAWSATSPVKTPGGKSLQEPVVSPAEGQVAKDTLPNTSPVADVNFFEDEMHVSQDGSRPQEDKMTDQHEPVTGSEIEEPVLEDIMMVDEDIDLIHEANELSLMDPHQNSAHDDTLSDASQEYGDENQIPIDPRMENERRAPVTPVRPMQPKFFHTTTKVPLKPAAEPTPSPLKKRSLSASRVAPKRPAASGSSSGQLFSRTPNKADDRTNSVPVTPTGASASNTDIWSTIGSPARTPHKDLNTALLRGAVVHVDVYTSEGADASGIFVELLTNMGARCVKTWHWNPDSSINEESSSNKIGITHVVYKDGGKRTLEKVRRTNGIVQCVGVSWVLDCERENEWLDERPYYIDTRLVPRGGARRRKSMEPKALANMNGTLVNNAAKDHHAGSVSDALDGQSMPKTPMDRRQSAMWMHTPSDHDGEDDDIEWSKFILTPVPKTPAPEAISRYAAELPETPEGSSNFVEDSPTKQAVMTRTCPPKQSQRHVIAGGAQSKDADEHVMLRLMSARRKSLQFAPKVGSPLAKTWR